jgi:aspartate aminotransferase-like enzyme
MTGFPNGQRPRPAPCRRPKLIAAVHAETSTAVLSDLEPQSARKGEALLPADCVPPLGGEVLDR